MKLLPDESVPKRLGSFFPGEFEVLHTTHGPADGVDRGIEYQQNLAYLTIPVIIIAHQSRLQELRPLVPEVIALASGNMQKRVYLISD